MVIDGLILLCNIIINHVINKTIIREAVEKFYSLMLRVSRRSNKINFIFFGLTLSGLEPTIYRTWGEHANHYTNAVLERLSNFTLIANNRF
jgi:hypothetical protein